HRAAKPRRVCSAAAATRHAAPLLPPSRSPAPNWMPARPTERCRKYAESAARDPGLQRIPGAEGNADARGPADDLNREGPSRRRSCVGRRLAGQRQKLRAPDTLAMRGVETAGDDEGGAGHGPDIGDLAEHHEAENADPDQLGVG